MSDAAEIGVFRRIEDVDRLVAAVGQIVAAGRGVDEADVEVGELRAGDIDGPNLLQLGRARGLQWGRGGQQRETDPVDTLHVMLLP